MLSGFFKDGKPYVKFEVCGIFNDAKKEITAQVDTGFDGYLLLPFTVAFPLGLVLKSIQTYTLADGTKTHNIVALGTVMLPHREFMITIDVHPTAPTLVGIKLLEKFADIITFDFLKEEITFKDLPPANK